MTDKRFTITNDFEEHHRQIRDNGHVIMGCFVEPQAEVLVDLLNELHEENQKLKQFIQELTTKGTGKIHLANGNVYKVNAILTDIKGD